MLKLGAATLSVMCLILWTSASPASSEEVLIETWQGSPELPDDMAYNTFLAMITGNGAKPVHVRRKLSRIFGIDGKSAEGAEEIDALYSWFLVSRSEIDLEVAEQTVVLLCTGDWQAMGREDVISGIEAHSAFRRAVTLDHYEASLGELSKVDRTAFLTYLEELKAHTAATRYNGRWYQESLNESKLRREHNAFCDGAFKQLAMQ